MAKYLLRVLSLALLFGFLGCSSVTRQSKKNTILDVSQESAIEGTGTSSADIRSMAERMAREINGIEWPGHQSHVRVALTTVDNQTRFPLNPNIIKDRLLTDLVELTAGGKLQFSENLAGADYFLSTRITALSKGTSEGVSDYLLYSFKLLDKADTVVWAKAYETKKQGSVGVMYR
jgi:penicillin-binding protein activator